MAKVPLDSSLTVTALRRALGDTLRRRALARGGQLPSASSSAAMLGVPHLYDMHSSLPQQLTNFAFSRSRVLRGAFEWIERFVVRRSRVVIVICPQLEEVVRGIEPGVPPVLIENAPGLGR